MKVTNRDEQIVDAKDFSKRSSIIIVQKWQWLAVYENWLLETCFFLWEKKTTMTTAATKNPSLLIATLLRLFGYFDLVAAAVFTHLFRLLWLFWPAIYAFSVRYLAWAWTIMLLWCGILCCHCRRQPPPLVKTGLKTNY